MDLDLILHFLNIPWVFLLWTTFLKSFVFLNLTIIVVSVTVFAERKVSAFIQDRVGPNRVGIPLTLLGAKKDAFFFGLGQMVADPIKLLTKENFVPGGVNKFYFWLAPKLVMVPPILVLAVLPFGSTLFGVEMTIANLNIGVLYIFAIASLSVYGITLAGWASNSKFPFLGGIRSSSQMISYELSMGLSIIPLFMICGSLNLGEIVDWQVKNGWLVAPFWPKGFSLATLLHPADALHAFTAGVSLQRLLLWIPLLISFVIFLVSIFAETNRLPFDLPEAEQELVGGYHTEYASMNFALFFLGEYAAMFAGSGAIVSLFLGGWSCPMIPDGSQGWFWGLVNIGVFFVKVSLMLLFMIWVRWTLPRFRYDQLMKLGWLGFFPIALFNIFLTAVILALVRN
ncbi:MAG: complex I subunit 1/NuoH family protein [Chthoniobacterales bacterium]|jgi:NADH-quinone oxidoreductase subunit H